MDEVRGRTPGEVGGEYTGRDEKEKESVCMHCMEYVCVFEMNTDDLSRRLVASCLCFLTLNCHPAVCVCAKTTECVCGYYSYVQLTPNSYEERASGFSMLILSPIDKTKKRCKHSAEQVWRGSQHARCAMQ